MRCALIGFRLGLWLGAAALVVATIGHIRDSRELVVSGTGLHESDVLAAHAGGSWVGSADAPVQVVEFTDFQCPFCAEAARRLHAIEARSPGGIAVIVRHFPLTTLHDHAFAAAVAAECAAAQGQFATYRHALLENQSELGVLPWSHFAAISGVEDLAAFERCVTEETFRDRVIADMDLGKGIGVRSTPSYVFNGELLVGVQAVERFGEAMETLAGMSLPASYPLGDTE